MWNWGMAEGWPPEDAASQEAPRRPGEVRGKTLIFIIGTNQDAWCSVSWSVIPSASERESAEIHSKTWSSTESLGSVMGTGTRSCWPKAEPAEREAQRRKKEKQKLPTQNEFTNENSRIYGHRYLRNMENKTTIGTWIYFKFLKNYEPNKSFKPCTFKILKKVTEKTSIEGHLGGSIS